MNATYPSTSTTSDSVALARADLRKRVIWPAIFAGVLIAIVLQLLLGLLGAAIGLSTLDVASNSAPDAKTLGAGAGIWLVASSAVSLFAGGWVAAHLAGSLDKVDASLHGLLMWALATIIGMYLISSALATVIGGSVKAATGVAQTATTAAAQNPDAVRAQVPNNLSVDALKEEAQKRLAPNAAAASDPAASPEQRAQAEARARQAADTAAKRSSQAALAAVLALAIGAIAATFGGAVGGRKYLVLDRSSVRT